MNTTRASPQSTKSLQHVKDASTSSPPPNLWVYGRACVAPLDFPLPMLSHHFAPPARLSFLPSRRSPGLEEATKGKPSRFWLICLCFLVSFRVAQAYRSSNHPIQPTTLAKQTATSRVSTSCLPPSLLPKSPRLKPTDSHFIYQTCLPTGLACSATP